jgi:ankyrin repeat protein
VLPSQASGYTPLMAASEYNRLDIVKLFLSKGAKTESQNRVSWTSGTLPPLVACVLPRLHSQLTHTASELADWYGHKTVLQTLVQEA